MSAQQLRPQAERALRRAATGDVEREERIQEEWDVVLANIQIALVHVDHVGKRIQVLDGRTVRIVNTLSVFQVRNAGDICQWLPVRKLDSRKIKFPAHDE